MAIGKLTVCLGMRDGIEPKKKAIQEAIAALGQKKSKERKQIVFVGFSKALQDFVTRLSSRESFLFYESASEENQTLRLLFCSSIYAVVFDTLADQKKKNNRLDLITQLLSAGINVFASSSLSYFDLCQKELGDILGEFDSKMMIPTSFFKYISRVILVNNFHEADIAENQFGTKNLSEKNLKERIANIAFTLATHIHYQNRHSPINDNSKCYKHAYKGNFSFLLPIANKTILINKGIKQLYQKLKKMSFYIVASFMSVVIAVYTAQLFSIEETPSITKLSVFVLAALIVNFISYPIVPAILSFVFATGLFLSGFNFYSVDHHILLKNIGIFVGLALSHLMLQNRRIIFQQIDELEDRDKRFNFLYSYTETLATVTNISDVFQVSEKYFKRAFNLRIMLILQNPTTLKTERIITAESNITIKDSESEMLVKQSNLDQYADYKFIPLVADTIEFGWIGIQPISKGDNSIDETLVSSAVLQFAIALQRINISQSYHSAVLNSEKEQLRSVILSSISHDLKTPLTTIIGSCTALEELENLSDKNRMVLVHTIHEASDQLNQFISNILDSSRLATENILQQTTLVYLDEVINVVLHRSKKILKLFDVSVKVSDAEAAAVYGDFTLIQQVFYNLIENATKYSPIGGKIFVVIYNVVDKVLVKVIDNGPGVIESKRNLVFDKFYRFQQTDQQKAGTGLGLSICKQIIEAYEGKIWVSDRDDGLKGAQFNIELPCAFSFKKTAKQKQVLVNES